MVLDTLAAMGRGAIYDQLDGGFHRYTLDRAWRIPHFEKMLYDNALLAEILTMTSVAADDADLERLARGTLEFLLRVMRLPSGAFKSAIDAETESVEGAFYIWDRRLLDAVLGDQESLFLAPILGYRFAAEFRGTRLYPVPDRLVRAARGQAGDEPGGAARSGRPSVGSARRGKIQASLPSRG